MSLLPPSSRGFGLPMGLPGATAATRYVGGTTSGAPVTGTFAVGDEVVAQDGKVWICTVAGTPGTWTQAGGASGYAIPGALSARGLIDETMQLGPVGAAGGSAMTDGRIVLGIVSVPIGQTITKVGAVISGAGTVATLFKFGLYKTDGTFLRATADVKASLAGSAWLLPALTSVYVADVASFYVAALFTGGGAPSLLSWGSGNAGAGKAVNSGVRPFAIVDGQTDLSGNVTPADTTQAYYMACA